MEDKQGTLKQILLITDGCSNVGDDPIDCAGKARRSNITVNVIGILDKGDLGKQGKAEAMCVAEAGGGMCRIVQTTELSATAQMLTHQTMQLTLQQIVNTELLQVMGKSTEDLPPQDRTRVLQVVDKLEEEVHLQIVVAVDTSASMKDKMATVREAIRDLTLSLQARQGSSQVAIVAFPGFGDDMVRLVQPFQSTLNLDGLEDIFAARGGTPTGPAIEFALSLFDREARPVNDVEDYPSTRWMGNA